MRSFVFLARVGCGEARTVSVEFGDKARQGNRSWFRVGCGLQAHCILLLRELTMIFSTRTKSLRLARNRLVPHPHKPGTPRIICAEIVPLLIPLVAGATAGHSANLLRMPNMMQMRIWAALARQTVIPGTANQYFASRMGALYRARKVADNPWARVKNKKANKKKY